MDAKEQLAQRLAEVLKFFKEEVSAIRGSRPSPALVEDIQVEYFGQKLPIRQLGSISVIPPREVQVTVWDANVADAVAKAISDKLNVQAAREGNSIHVNLPSLTQERREELLKVVRAKAEEARIKSRTIRDEIKKEASASQKEGTMTEDDMFELQEQMQKQMDAFNKEADALVEKKTKEIHE